MLLSYPFICISAYVCVLFYVIYLFVLSLCDYQNTFLKLKNKEYGFLTYLNRTIHLNYKKNISRKQRKSH